MSESDDLFAQYFNGTREERARCDGEAIADPTKPNGAEMELAALLADVLGYRPTNAGQHARWLLLRCENDYDGLRRLIVAMRQRGDLGWVQAQGKTVYSLRAVLVEEYQREHQAEEKRAALNTTEGRRARYASYPGVLS